MTAASELKSAAVVQIESRKRKTLKEESKTGTNAVEGAVKQVQVEAGSTTATVTETVTPATTKVASATAENATSAISGSTAAITVRAASMQATRLPVSVFFQNSSKFPASYQNPVRLRPRGPEPFWRASRAGSISS